MLKLDRGFESIFGQEKASANRTMLTREGSGGNGVTSRNEVITEVSQVYIGGGSDSIKQI